MGAGSNDVYISKVTGVAISRDPELREDQQHCEKLVKHYLMLLVWGWQV